MTNFTKKEEALFTVLVRLGDTKEQAEKTVLSERSKIDNHDVYDKAYRS